LKDLINKLKVQKANSKLSLDVKISVSDISIVKNKSLESLSQEAGWQIDMFDFPEVWRETKGKGVKVAVLDTGVAENHPDLEIKKSMDFVGIGSTSWWDAENEKVIAPDIDYSSYTPTHSHATHVSGIIGAKDNDLGMIGVAPECDIYALRVLNDSGSGSYTDISIALLWCLYNEDIDVINMSLGGLYGNEDLWGTLKLLYDNEIPVIVSAGNEYYDPEYRGYIGFPAQYDETISVAAIDQNSERAYFSSVGPNLDVAAPGVGILSSVLGDTYAAMSGTSMAAPFVTGLVALMIAKHRLIESNTPLDGVEEIRSHLQKISMDDGVFENRDIYLGWGIVNVKTAIEKIKKERESKTPFGRYYAGSIIGYNDRPWELR
jgi:subtilisin family serine protease